MRTKRLLAVSGVLALVTALVGAIADGEVIQRGKLRVTFDGQLTPKALPRSGGAPVRVSVGAKIGTTNDSAPPQLTKMTIALNGAGQISPDLLPVCTVPDIQPSTTENALAACGDSLVGQGTFEAKVLVAQEAAFPAAGKLFAFNGRWHGKPAILAHVYGTDPVPTSFTLPFVLTETGGTYGTVLSASLPGVTGKGGYITGLSLNLGRTVGSGPSRGSYISASCEAPKGFDAATFAFARAQFAFAKTTVTSQLIRTCEVSR